VRNALAALALALVAAGCDLSYNNSRFSCDQTAGNQCPSGLSCVNGYCEVTSTSGGSTSGGTTGGTTSGGTTTGGTTGAICNDPASGLCPANTPTNYLSCTFGCCAPELPYACGYTALCYASADAAASDCADAGQPCSTCVTQWCSAPVLTGACLDPNPANCGGACCDLAHPWYCAGTGMCYLTQAAALAQCTGNSCTYCTPACTTTSLTGLCDGGVTCDGTCCPPELPFFCPTTNYCFASNAEAYQNCPGSCVACAP